MISKRATGFTLMLAVLFSVTGCSTTRPDGPPSGQETSAQVKAANGEPLRLSPTELASRARDAVVTLIAYRDGEVLQSGTGFFIRKDGVLVTNLHVVAGADRLSVELPDGEIFDAVYMLSKDARRDLILLQIPVAEVPALTIADERAVQVGDAVYAIGNPLGLKGTFSNGLVSAKRVEDGVTYLQITAPISEGSSGGPVMNERGEVIGVATAFFADGQNLNMAIPARHASGMLALASSPTRFELMAAEIKTEEQQLVESRAQQTQELLEALPRETRAHLQELGEYERQTAIRMLALDAYMASEGWTYLEDLMDAGTLASDELDAMYVTLDRGNYLVAALCDDDCTDLDMMVSDSAEEVIGVDAEVDPEPMVELDVPYRQQYAVTVGMIDCAAEECVYSILIFRRD